MSELESTLRDWMTQRAGRVHASERLVDADYRPRTRTPLPRPRLAISGGLTVAAAILVAMLMLSRGASNAFAGWTAVPRTPSPAELAAARAYCTRNVPMPGIPLKLTDQRGAVTIQVYSKGGANDFCTLGPSFHNTSGWTSSPPVHPAAGRLFLWTDHTFITDRQSYGTMIALVGRGVRAVRLTLGDGSEVTATVEHGWAAAWWPGSHHLLAARVTTAAGTHTQRFAAYPCDVHKCGGSGPHGG